MWILWGYVKDRVYVPPPPATVDELQERITAAVNSVKPDMLQRVWSELDYHIDVCRVTKGGTLSVCDITWNCMSLIKGEFSKKNCLEKMVYSAIETTCFGLYWPSSGFYNIKQDSIKAVKTVRGCFYSFYRLFFNIVEIWRWPVKAETCSLNCIIYNLFYTSYVLTTLSFN